MTARPDHYLIKLLCHLPDDIGVLHVGVHVRCDLAFTSGAADKELDQLQ